mgnify:CR=1 FL=1
MINKSKKTEVVFTGAEAAAVAMKQINPGVISIYPITPQTYIAENIAKFVADGEMSTEQINVESEHSALSVVTGAEAAGVRAMTATSSQGLALMWEILSVVSGLRLPVVMNVVNRALSAPINIHADHSDAMGARDLGWIQIFSENPQEVYDHTLLALKLAENKDILLPVMVCQDGFITSHCSENMRILPDVIVKKFIGEYAPTNKLLDINNPITIGPLVLPDYFLEIKKMQSEAILNALKIYLKIAKELSALTGRSYDYFEEYKTKDAKAVIVVMSSSAGTTRQAIDELRQKGLKVGLIKIRLFRPFPYEAIAKVLKNIKIIGVLDRAESLGAHPPLGAEIKNSLYGRKLMPIIKDYIYGLGGRDLTVEQIKDVYKNLLKQKQQENSIEYIGLNE